LGRVAEGERGGEICVWCLSWTVNECMCRKGKGAYVEEAEEASTLSFDSIEEDFVCQVC